MSIFHAPIKRTFHRKAKNGIVKADGQTFKVTSPSGEQYDGAVTLRINIPQPEAHVKGDVFSVLNLEQIV